MTDPAQPGAILVAREYGLPAVVAAEGETTELETSQAVRVDGVRGTVEVLDESVGVPAG